MDMMPEIFTACPPVAHIDTGRGWRGGQQQTFYLAKALAAHGAVTAVVCQPDAPLAHRCRAAGIRLFITPMRGEWDAVAGWRLARWCRSQGYRLLHAHCAHGLAVCLWARLFFPRVRIVATRRVDFPIGRSLLRRFKYTNAWVDRIVCISHAIREILLREGLPPHKLAVVHSGVDNDRFTDADPSRAACLKALPAGAVVVGTVAAFADHKDYPTLLAAARQVLRRHPDAVFCAVGDGELRERVFALARRYGLGTGFIFAGFQEDVGAYLKRFDVFVLSSHMEGLGSSLLDAMSLGLPVVATRVGGIPEVVVHGETGILVPPRNPAALAQAIKELIDGRPLRERLGRRARQAAAQFSHEKMVRGNLSVYLSLAPPALRIRNGPHGA